MGSLECSPYPSPPGKVLIVCFLSLACLLCNLKLMPSFGKQNLIVEQAAPPAKQITSVLPTFPAVFFFFFLKNQKFCVCGITSAVVQFRFNLE